MFALVDLLQGIFPVYRVMHHWIQNHGVSRVGSRISRIHFNTGVNIYTSFVLSAPTERFKSFKT